MKWSARRYRRHEPSGHLEEQARKCLRKGDCQALPDRSALAAEVAPFGIRTTIVEPGFFRTDLIEDTSTVWSEPTIDDYAQLTSDTVEGWKSMKASRAATRRSWPARSSNHPE